MILWSAPPRQKFVDIIGLRQIGDNHRRTLQIACLAFPLGNSGSHWPPQAPGALPICQTEPRALVLIPYASLKSRGFPNRGPNPDHAPWEPFSHVFRGGARDRCDQLIGATSLSMQRVWV